MTFLPKSPTDSPSEQAMNEALAEIERALLKFERILAKRASGIKSGRGGSILSEIFTTPKQSKNSIYSSILSRTISTIFNPPQQRSGDFNPNSGGANRFPTSNNMGMSDLATYLQKILQRNL